MGLGWAWHSSWASALCRVVAFGGGETPLLPLSAVLGQAPCPRLLSVSEHLKCLGPAPARGSGDTDWSTPRVSSTFATATLHTPRMGSSLSLAQAGEIHILS